MNSFVEQRQKTTVRRPRCMHETNVLIRQRLDISTVPVRTWIDASCKELTTRAESPEASVTMARQVAYLTDTYKFLAVAANVLTPTQQVIEKGSATEEAY
jgi:hypothetical protein